MTFAKALKKADAVSARLPVSLPARPAAVLQIRSARTRTSKTIVSLAAVPLIPVFFRMRKAGFGTAFRVFSRGAFYGGRAAVFLFDGGIHGSSI